MTDLDARIVAALDAASPQFDGEAGDWQQVLRDAAGQHSRGWARRAGLLAAAAAAVLAVLLAWPFGGAERGGVLDRALAAVGDGPVLHVVLEGSWGGEVVDLQSGRRSRLPGISETWYDEERNVVRRVSRLGEVVQDDVTYRPGECAGQPGVRACFGRPDEAALARAYRDALESGSARVSGADVVGGTPVYWIVVRREELPDVADGRVHPWTQQVAVSRTTYEPVATRETRDGVEGPGTRQLVRTLEYVSADTAGFGDPARRPASGPFAFEPGFGQRLTLGAARELVPGLVWLGEEFRGLPFAWAGRTTWKSGYDRARGIWNDEVDGVLLVYGRLRVQNGSAALDGPSIVIRETLRRLPPPLGGPLVPPAGSAYVSGGNAVVRTNGVFAVVQARDESVALAAARALAPVRKE